MKKSFLVAALMLFIPWGAMAQTPGKTLAFAEIWNLVQQNSPSIQAAGYELKAAKIGEDRAGEHWYPRLYADARAFETNDPALSFMSVLEERQIGPSDFAASSLNEPQDSFYERGTLGLDFPLFEGGAKVALAESARKGREAKEMEMQAVATGQYGQLAGTYASLLVLSDELENLGKLGARVEDILKNYSIGSKSNPVGYSGLLGLKTLANRLTGLQAQAHAQQVTLKSQIQIQATTLTGDWSPTPGRAKDFLELVLPLPAQPQDPAFVRAAQRGAESVEKMRGAQNALLLPKVALFGEGYLNGGDRSSATGYTAGAYLQWDLLDLPNFGAGEEAEDSAKAAQAHAETLQQMARMDQVQAQESLGAIKANLDLMDDSSKLLEEQTETARNLFKNGSINALQLVEVLARRADLITNRAQAEMDLVQAHISLSVNSGFEESIHDNQ